MDLLSVINDLEAKAKENIKTEPSDYRGQDGLLYCGNCNTPKQCRVVIFGKERTPYCLCKCAEEKRDREEAEQKARVEAERKAERIKTLRKLGFPDADKDKDRDLQNWTFANDDMANPKITNAMQKYVDNFAEFRKQGKGLILYGTVGIGKTYAACEVANALIDKGIPVLVTNFARLTNIIQGKFDGRQEYIDSLNEFELLVIDDLSSERDTEYINEQIFQIVDARYRAALPMIITTNLSIDELKNPENIRKQRIYDRVLERCHPVLMEGQSRRRKKIREEYDEMQHLLGL